MSLRDRIARWRISRSSPEKISLNELLEEQYRRSCEDYLAEIRDCTCVWPRTTTDASHIGDLYCPRHGVSNG